MQVVLCHELLDHRRLLDLVLNAMDRAVPQMFGQKKLRQPRLISWDTP
jgi:hypothetical protein